MKAVIIELFWILLALALLGVVVIRANQGGKAWAKLYRKLLGDREKSK